MELAHQWKGYFNNAGTVIRICRVLCLHVGLPVYIVMLLNIVLTNLVIPGHMFITLFQLMLISVLILHKHVPVMNHLIGYELRISVEVR